MLQAKIAEFIASIDSELARPNRFSIFVALPQAIASTTTNASSQRLAYRCETGELPGRTIAAADQKTYGPVQRHPFLSTYNDVTFSFICSGDMAEKKVFDAWMDIINPTADMNVGNTFRSKWDFAYRKEYTTDILINQYTTQDDIAYSVKLFEAFPIAANQLDLDWGIMHQYHKLSVTFAYTSWAPIDQQKTFREPTIDPKFNYTNVGDNNVNNLTNQINGGIGQLVGQQGSSLVNTLGRSAAS